MPDDDWMLAQGTVDFRNEERMARHGRTLQLPACDRCTQGVMDATNNHYLGICECDCHAENPAYGPGNPDWEHDRDRESRATARGLVNEERSD